MPKYRYKAIDDTGKLRRGDITAFGEIDVEDKLETSGLTLIQAKEIGEGGFKGLVGGKGVKPRLMIEFYHRLAQTLALGLPILSALEENARVLPSKPLKETIQEIHMAIEGGKTLFEAMSRFPGIFHKLDLAIVRLGEETGVLPASLKELAEFLEWKEDIRSTLMRAAVYPSFIVTAIIAVVGVWVGYVLPQMATLLLEMGVQLPLVTRLVLHFSILFKAYWGLAVAGSTAGAVLLYLYHRTPKGVITIHKAVLKLPFIGTVLLNISLARLSHNFATMHGAGMTINNIFEILTGNVLGNQYLESRLKAAFEDIQRGESIAASFDAAGGFPTLLVGAVRNGEVTGTLDDAFRRLGTFYDGEVKRNVQSMIGAIEPLSIVLLGGVFGLIALSIMLPLYDVISEIR